MNFDLDDEQSILRDMAERFVREQYGLEAHRGVVASREGFHRPSWKAFGEMGWLALALPESAGGMGFGAVEVSILMTAFGQGLVLTPYATTILLCGRIIERCAPADADALLEQVGTGDLILGFAHEEAGGRYEPTPVAAAARRSGDGFVLSGAKAMVLDGAAAGRLIVSARVEGEQGYSLFLVDPATAGVSVSAYPLIDGGMAADIGFDEVALAADALLASGPEAVAILEEARDRAVIGLVGPMVGAMEACVDMTSDYARERHQFGQPIGKFQAVQHLAAEMFAQSEQARSILYQALANIDREPALRARAVSAAKIVAGLASQVVSRSAVQIHGAYGVTDEFAISHHFKRLQVLEKLFGDIDHHTARYAALAEEAERLELA